MSGDPCTTEERPSAGVYDLTVRRGDLDERGEARAGVFFEYFQEARIRYLMDMHTRGERWSQHVVARTDIDYLAPVHHRQEPYAVHSWVGHLGSRSFTIRSEVRDDDRVLASAAVVMVTFDMETQRTTEMTAAAARAAGEGAALARPRAGTSSMVLTMNCAAWVTYSQNCASCSGRQVGLVEGGAEVPQPVLPRRRGHRERRVPHPQPRVAARSE